METGAGRSVSLIGSVGGSGGSDVSASFKVMADKHGVVKTQLAKTKREVEEKTKQLRLLEEENYLKEGTLCVMEQKLRTVNEKLFEAQNSWKEKDQRHEARLKELVDVQWKHQLSEQSVQKVESLHLDFQVDRAIRVDEVLKLESVQRNADEDNGDYAQIKKDIEVYKGFRAKIDSGDPEAERILSGKSLLDIEQRKDSIRDAFQERDARAEMVYLEIDEKNEAMQRLKQSIQIKEKQNQAKLRKLSKELQDVEETEKHLKRTAEYLARQIDPSLKTIN